MKKIVKVMSRGFGNQYALYSYENKKEAVDILEGKKLSFDTLSARCNFSYKFLTAQQFKSYKNDVRILLEKRIGTLDYNITDKDMTFNNYTYLFEGISNLNK